MNYNPTYWMRGKPRLLDKLPEQSLQWWRTQLASIREQGGKVVPCPRMPYGWRGHGWAAARVFSLYMPGGQGYRFVLAWEVRYIDIMLIVVNENGEAIPGFTFRSDGTMTPVLSLIDLALYKGQPEHERRLAI